MGFSDYFPKENVKRFVEDVTKSPHLKQFGRDVSQSLANNLIFPAGDRLVKVTSFPYDDVFWNGTAKPFVNDLISTAFGEEKALTPGA